MRPSSGPFGEEPAETESRRLTPSIGLTPEPPESVSDTSNEDFLFHLYRGSELLQDSRVHEAKEELERALRLQPRDSKGQDLLAVVYFRLGLYPRAIAIYEQLRRRNTGDTALLLNLALCYLKTGQPHLARRDLEQLLSLNPNHARAWGYLGLACERLGDFAQAQRAFEEGGHSQMAKRIAARRDSLAARAEGDAEEGIEATPEDAVEESDAGDELSFALARTHDDDDEEATKPNSWQVEELLKSTEARAVAIASVKPSRPPHDEPTARLADEKPSHPPRDESRVDTRDVPPAPGAGPSIPQLGLPPSLGRRPTLIAPVGAPPEASPEAAAVERIPSQKSPTFTLDEAGAPSYRKPVVAVPSPFGPRRDHAQPERGPRKRTLPPPVHSAPYAAPPAVEEAPAPPAPPVVVPAPEIALAAAMPASTSIGSMPIPTPRIADGLAQGPVVVFPVDAGVTLHASGVALVSVRPETGFAARLESIRAQANGLGMRLLERHVRGKASGESFGGVGSPVVFITGDGQLILAARPGRRLSAFALHDDMCFAREDVLLGFDGQLAFENGRLATGEGEFVPVVQVRGSGVVLLEATGEALTLEVRANRGISVRRDAVLGWFGRLVPRALAPSEAPCGQRGLVSFAGDGRVLVASA